MREQFYAMMSRMKLINRWGLMRNARVENVSEHSLETAVIAHALAVIRNRCFGGNVSPERAALLGIFHDSTEIITGDLPTPVKYFAPSLRESYKKAEESAAQKLLSMLPEEIRGDYVSLIGEKNDCDRDLWEIVKAADKFSALIKCVEERSAGNTDFIKAQQTTLETIKGLGLPEADYFAERFMQGFDKTIDENIY